MAWKDKTIVVTGAAGGMGKAVVDLLLKAEANVVGCDLSVARLSEYADQPNFIALQGDLLKEAEVKNVFAEAEKIFGDIDGLVNAAGIAQSSTPIEEVSLQDWHHMMDINMTMIFLTCREVCQSMKKNEHGVIVNIGSVSTTRPRPGLQSYVASKGAVESFTKTLALEMAPYKVNVNVLHPGPCDTSMLGQFAGEDGDIDDMKENEFRKSVPLGELLTPEDIANSVKFLLSSEAKMVTGSVFHVDGGRNV